MFFFLQMFDGHGNHVMEGSEVHMNLEGFEILDQLGLNRKVRFIINFLTQLCCYKVIFKP